MSKRPAQRQILLQMSSDLVRSLDRLAKEQGRSRAAVVRDAVTRYVADESETEKDRRLVEGYVRIPDTDEEMEWAEESLREMFEAGD